jgi:hypothetical protein
MGGFSNKKTMIDMTPKKYPTKPRPICCHKRMSLWDNHTETHDNFGSPSYKIRFCYRCEICGAFEEWLMHNCDTSDQYAEKMRHWKEKVQ